MAAYHHALRSVEAADVLDFGCGSGYGLNFLWRRGRPRSVRGVDVSETAVAYCQTSYPDIADRFGAIGAAPLSSGSERYDVVVLFQTIEHVPDPLALLREIRQVLRESSQVLITTPNDRVDRQGANPFHLHAFTRESLRKTCASAFPVVEELGLRGSCRVGGRGLGLERFVAYRALRRLARALGLAPEPAPISLADFRVGARRIEEALDLFFVCRLP